MRVTASWCVYIWRPSLEHWKLGAGQSLWLSCLLWPWFTGFETVFELKKDSNQKAFPGTTSLYPHVFKIRFIRVVTECGASVSRNKLLDCEHADDCITVWSIYRYFFNAVLLTAASFFEKLFCFASVSLSCVSISKFQMGIEGWLKASQLSNKKNWLERWFMGYLRLS